MLLRARATVPPPLSTPVPPIDAVAAAADVRSARPAMAGAVVIEASERAHSGVSPCRVMRMPGCYRSAIVWRRRPDQYRWCTLARLPPTVVRVVPSTLRLRVHSSSLALAYLAPVPRPEVSFVSPSAIRHRSGSIWTTIQPVSDRTQNPSSLAALHRRIPLLSLGLVTHRTRLSNTSNFSAASLTPRHPCLALLRFALRRKEPADFLLDMQRVSTSTAPASAGHMPCGRAMIIDHRRPIANGNTGYGISCVARTH